MIQVTNITHKGRGITAIQDIPQGTLLEVAPASIIPSEIRNGINQIEIFKYFFVLPSEYKENKDVNAYLVFGLASLCNHHQYPNSRVEWVEKETGIWSHLIAQKDIKRSEEVTLFYTNIDEYVHEKEFV